MIACAHARIDLMPLATGRMKKKTLNRWNYTATKGLEGASCWTLVHTINTLPGLPGIIKVDYRPVRLPALMLHGSMVARFTTLLYVELVGAPPDTFYSFVTALSCVHRDTVLGVRSTLDTAGKLSHLEVWQVDRKISKFCLLWKQSLDVAV